MAYYDPELTGEAVIQNLINLDMELAVFALNNDIHLEKKVKMVIAGSSSLIMNGINLPKTQDIDVLRISHVIDDDLLEKYKMNCRISAYENSLPYNYEDRLVEYPLETQIVYFWAISIEDAVAGKIYAWRDKDKDHIYSTEVLNKIDWLKLRVCIEELRLSVLNDKDYEWIKHRFNIYARGTNHEEFIFKDIF